MNPIQRSYNMLPESRKNHSEIGVFCANFAIKAMALWADISKAVCPMVPGMVTIMTIPIAWKPKLSLSCH